MITLSVPWIACDKEKTDLSGSPEIRVPTTTIIESDQPVETVHFTASIDDPRPEELVFTWSVEGRTALPGHDLVAINERQAVIPAGNVSITLPVDILGDTLMEFTEQFLIRISQPGRQERQTVITILNDDYINPEWTEEGTNTALHYPGMQLVWHDEFDGSQIDTEFWNYDAANAFPINCGGDDGQIGKYTGDSDHLRLEQGRLIITATLDTLTGIYRTSRINSMDKVNIKFGRIDIRAKLAGASGLASGLSMIGSAGEWPAGGEIEITKMAGSRPLSITSGLIYDDNGPQMFEKQFPVENEDQALTDFFHIYTLLWEEDRITWLLDYVPLITIDRQGFTGNYLYNEPFFFRINLAVGGLFAGDPDDPFQLPSDIEVDFIRVYQPPQENTEP